jgi:hypothetical protein
MPTISMFYGILIRMYVGDKEHNPPHFHAIYEEFDAIVDIVTGEIVRGDFPRKQAKLVTAWAELHREELKADWEIAKSGETPFRIEPLK